MCFKHALFLKCETNRFWNCKNNVKQMIFLKQFWSFVPFPSAFDFMFLLLVVIALLQILSRSAICTVHFRSIWTAPLRFSTCRSWAGSKVTAAKLDPKKSKFHLPNWMFKCVFFTFFSFTFFFTFFSKCIFKTHFFTFFPSAFSKHFKKKKNIFYIFVKHVKTCKTTAFWKCVWKNMWTNASWTCEKHVNRMWKNVNKWEQKGSWKVPVS